MFDIYRKPQFDETLQKIETRTYYPFVKAFNNNDVIDIAIQQGDSWFLMSDAALVIEGKLTKLGGDGDVSLVHNAGAFLFNRISYDINGKEVDYVRDPGIVTTLKGYLCYSKSDSVHLSIAGWNFPQTPIVNSADGTFVLRIPLHHLFSIFTDYKMAQFGKQALRLVRSRDDKDAILIAEKTANPTTPTTAQLELTNVALKVNIAIPNDMLKLNLLESIRSDRSIIIPFRRWEYHELPQLTVGATKQIWSVKTCTAVESPRYIVLAFQINRRGDSLKDCTRFDNIDLRDVRVMLNGEYYPTERMQLNFENNNFGDAHYNYTEFYSSFKNDYDLPKQALLDYKEYKNRAIFVIDCSKRNESLKSNTVDVKIDIEANKGFPSSTKAYCIIIHDCIIEHLPLSEVVRSLI